MSEIIGVDPGKLLGLQRDVAERFRIALEKGDPDIPNAIEALLKATPGRRKLFSDGHLFRGNQLVLQRGDKKPDIGGDELVDHDPRSLRIKQIDWAHVRLESFYEGQNQDPLTGQQKLEMLKRIGYVRLDSSWADVLLKDYYANRGDSVLDYLEKERGVRYIDFFGTITYYKGDKERSPGRKVTVISAHHNGWGPGECNLDGGGGFNKYGWVSPAVDPNRL